jgi:hypothetical protein
MITRGVLHLADIPVHTITLTRSSQPVMLEYTALYMSLASAAPHPLSSIIPAQANFAWQTRYWSVKKALVQFE